MAKAAISTETLLTGAALAGVGVFLWSKRSTLFPAAAPGATDAFGVPIVSGGSSSGPLLTAPIQLPSPVQTSLANPLIYAPSALTYQPQPVYTAAGAVTPSNLNPQVQGCVVGAQGGLYCPDAPGAVVLDDQRNACYGPTSQEVDACLRRKPTWSRDQAATRLTQLRAAYCAAKATRDQAIRDGDPGTRLTAEAAMQDHYTDYFALTGVQLL